MKYLFEKPELNCVELEKELGLKRGDIAEITIDYSGAVEIETKNVLTDALKAKLQEALEKRNLPRGKKPELEM